MKFPLVLWMILVLVFGIQDNKRIRIFLAGDSTMADKPLFPNHPERGWGQVFPLYFQANVEVLNFAVNGRSTKSFRNTGRWDEMIAQVREGDYVIIQFGHNDQKTEDPNRYSKPEDYAKNLDAFVNEVKAKRAIPILATPVSRRSFNEKGELVDTHLEYAFKVRELASSKNIILLDVHQKSMDLLRDWGPEKSKELFLHYPAGYYEKFPDGITDDTHFSPTGAFRISDLVIEECKVKIPELAAYLKRRGI